MNIEKKIQNFVIKNFVILSILFLGLMLRIIYILHLYGSVFYSEPISDAKIYYIWAHQFIKGKIIYSYAFFLSPFYAYFLGLFILFFPNSLVIPRILNIILDLSVCLLIFLIGKKVYSRKVGLLASFIYALYKPAIFYTAFILPVTLTTFLITLFVYLIIIVEKKRLSHYFLLGIISGLMVLSFSKILIFIPFVIIYFFIERVRNKKSGIVVKKSLLLVTFFLLGLCIIISLATIHNFIAEQSVEKSSKESVFSESKYSLVLINSSTGYDFYIGNNERADGTFKIVDNPVYTVDPRGKQITENILEQKLDSSELRSFWQLKSSLWITEHPIKFVFLLMKKVLIFFHYREVPYIYSYVIRHDAPLLWIPLFGFVVVGPLAILGILLTKKDVKENWLFSFLIISVLLIATIFYVCDWLRLFVVPILLLYASYTFFDFLRIYKEREYKKLIVRLTLLLLIFIVTIFHTFWFPYNINRDKSTYYYGLGLIYEKERNFSLAESHYQMALTFENDNDIIVYFLANLYKKEGKIDLAIRYIKFAMQLNPKLLLYKQELLDLLIKAKETKK